VPANTLYYGDNLDILRRYVADESIDLGHPGLLTALRLGAKPRSRPQ